MDDTGMPDGLRSRLEAIDKFEMVFESKIYPLVMAKIPWEKFNTVRNLEGVVDVNVRSQFS